MSILIINWEDAQTHEVIEENRKISSTEEGTSLSNRSR
jgi:hypothetical protein